MNKYGIVRLKDHWEDVPEVLELIDVLLELGPRGLLAGVHVDENVLAAYRITVCLSVGQSLLFLATGTVALALIGRADPRVSDDRHGLSLMG